MGTMTIALAPPFYCRVYQPALIHGIELFAMEDFDAYAEIADFNAGPFDPQKHLAEELIGLDMKNDGYL